MTHEAFLLSKIDFLRDDEETKIFESVVKMAADDAQESLTIAMKEIQPGHRRFTHFLVERNLCPWDLFGERFDCHAKGFYRTIFELDNLVLFQKYQEQIKSIYFHSRFVSDLHKELVKHASVNILDFLKFTEEQAKSCLSTTVDYILNDRKVTDKRRRMMEYLCKKYDTTMQLTNYFMYFFRFQKEYFLRFLMELGVKCSPEQLATLRNKDERLYDKVFSEDV